MAGVTMGWVGVSGGCDGDGYDEVVAAVWCLWFVVCLSTWIADGAREVTNAGSSSLILGLQSYLGGSQLYICTIHDRYKSHSREEKCYSDEVQLRQKRADAALDIRFVLRTPAVFDAEIT